VPSLVPPGPPGQALPNICFSTTDALLSRWIRWYTGAPVSHALITFRSETLGKVMVREAGGHGFHMVPWSRWADGNRITARFRLRVPPDLQRHALYRMADHLGEAYDSRGLFGFVPRLADRLRGKGAKLIPRPRSNPLDDPRRLFCSEAVATFLLYAGFHEVTEPCRWSPADLYRFADTDRRFERLPIRAAAAPRSRRAPSGRTEPPDAGARLPRENPRAT